MKKYQEKIIISLFAWLLHALVIQCSTVLLGESTKLHLSTSAMTQCNCQKSEK